MEDSAEIDLEKEDLMPKDIIEDIMVHPFADDHYVEEVKKYCSKYNLKFLGKSKLYDFE